MSNKVGVQVERSSIAVAKSSNGSSSYKRSSNSRGSYEGSSGNNGSRSSIFSRSNSAVAAVDAAAATQ